MFPPHHGIGRRTGLPDIREVSSPLESRTSASPPSKDISLPSERKNGFLEREEYDNISKIEQLPQFKENPLAMEDEDIEYV
mmetsp:Transcript_15309/g.21122  ORF Transcript_15309/g.21122 Transcript_15309/m.21122 type:complete len:81 (+) Transcript_15309:98-340(+)